MPGATITIGADTFTRANNGSSWGTASNGATWATNVGTPSLSISSNEGHATNISAQAAMQLGSVTSANMEGLVRCKTSASTSTRMGVALRFTASNTFYHARLSANGNTFTIAKVVSGTNTDLFSTSFTVSTATFYWIRFRAIGTTLEARAWADGGSEPSTWTVSGTDSSITGAGGFGLTINATSTSVTWDFDSYTVTDGTLTETLQVRARIATQSTKTLQSRLLLNTLRTRTLQARFVLSANIVTKTLQVRFRLRSLSTRTLQTRLRLSTLGNRTLQARLRLITQRTGTLQARFLLRTLRTRTLQVRAKIVSQRTGTLQVRVVLGTPGIGSGGFALFSNGAGTAQFDHFRVTEYPDPALSLAPIAPRIGATIASWNAILPNNTSLGVDLSYDGVNWINVTSSNGGSFPTIYSQPEPSIDGFDTNTAVNYNSSSRAGGSVATWTYDTAYSRIAATGGVNAIYSYTLISRSDVDFFTDMDRADAGGLAWRFADPNNFYCLVVGDSLASVGSKNTITLYKVASNVQTTLGTATISFTRGTYHRFRVSMLSGVITVYMDGDTMITYTDGSPLGAGTVGLYNNGGSTGSRYYQLWISPQGDHVTGTPDGDTVTGRFVYTRLRLATTDPTVTPQVEDISTTALTPAIGAGVSIPSVTYDDAFLNSNFDDLAKQSNYSWYVDESRSFVFRSGATVAAPWIIQSAPEGLVPWVDLEADDTLELDVGNDLYRNRQRIKGAQDTLTTSANFIGDGSATSFTLGYHLAEQPTIYLNGVKQSVGLKGLTGYQWYWAVDDPVIEQDSSETVLGDTDQLSVPDYTGLFDVPVVVDDLVEQAAHALLTNGTGIVESVLDVTGQGMRKDAAITLANQLIARYAIAGRTLIFNTSRNGLSIGQALSIFFPERGIFDKQFLITEIDITLRKGVGDTQIWWYKVTCSELPKQASWAKLIASGLGLQ